MSTSQEKGNSKRELWIVHSGCTNHVCATKSLFSSFNEDCESTVRLSDGSSIKAQGKGNINVKTNTGSVGTITDVLYVPSLNRNILSVGKLTDKGHGVSMGQGKCKISDSAERIIAYGHLNAERVYPLELETIQSSSAAETYDFLF